MVAVSYTHLVSMVAAGAVKLLLSFAISFNSLIISFKCVENRVPAHFKISAKTPFFRYFVHLGRGVSGLAQVERTQAAAQFFKQLHRLQSVSYTHLKNRGVPLTTAIGVFTVMAVTCWGLCKGIAKLSHVIKQKKLHRRELRAEQEKIKTSKGKTDWQNAACSAEWETRQPVSYTHLWEFC